MIRKPIRPPVAKANNVVAASGASRKLLIKRLREIDKLTAKELATLMDAAEKIRGASPPKL